MRACGPASVVAFGALFAASAIVAKAREDAGTKPLRIFGVRAGALLGKLGLENGDRLEALDDRPLAMEADAREAFAEARAKKRFSFKLQRKSATTTLIFNVR